MGTAITPIAKNITQFLVTSVQIDAVALTMTIYVSRQDVGGNQLDTQAVLVTAAQFNAAWTGGIVGTIVALAKAAPQVIT